MNIQLLMTGDELMTGVTVDSNSARIARALAVLGLEVAGKVTVGDRLPVLTAELARLSSAADVLIVNGGLGPTVDDRTAEALADVAGVALREHPDALAHLEQWLGERGLPLNAANRKQARLPDGCEILPNPIGSAVGFSLSLNNCRVLCTPGVPGELERMLHDEVLPRLQQRFPGIRPVRQSRFHLFGIGESSLQQWISDALPDWPAALELGFRAGAPTLEVKITSQAGDDALHDTWRDKLHNLMGDYVVATGNGSLADTLVALLRERKLRLATAESCTGGGMARLLTQAPGASAVFEAGFVTYSDRMKTALLDVPADVLTQYGAVSEPVVRAMVAGALARSQADYAVAVSGIAGPDGGSPDKPVGTVWVGWGTTDAIQARALYFPLGRSLFQTLVSALGLDLVRRAVLGIAREPRYFTERSLPRPDADR